MVTASAMARRSMWISLQETSDRPIWVHANDTSDPGSRASGDAAGPSGQSPGGLAVRSVDQAPCPGNDHLRSTSVSDRAQLLSACKPNHTPTMGYHPAARTGVDDCHPRDVPLPVHHAEEEVADTSRLAATRTLTP